jgi:hypothetical protein
MNILIWDNNSIPGANLELMRSYNLNIQADKEKSGNKVGRRCLDIVRGTALNFYINSHTIEYRTQ